MKEDMYNRILSIIRTTEGSQIIPNRECFKVLHEEFPDVSDYTIGSIYSLEYMRKMKRNHFKISKFSDILYKLFITAVEEKQPEGILLRMSEELDLSPALLARMMVEEHYQDNFEIATEDSDEEAPPTIVSATILMKDSTLIEDPNLAVEVFLCTLHDDQYGPIADCIKHSIGQMCEMELVRMARNAGLSFRSEGELRTRGFDKTPDIKLDIPVAVDGVIIHWIESKALFGDVEAHKAYLKDQYLCYWNRFGPGIVIYWFGFVDSISNRHQEQIMVYDQFPANITLIKTAKPRNPKHVLSE